MKLQIEAQKLQLEQAKIEAQVMDSQSSAQIDGFNAETKRIDSQIKAQQAGATIDRTQIQAFGDELDNQAKMNDMMDEQERKAKMKAMGINDLMRIANGG